MILHARNVGGEGRHVGDVVLMAGPGKAGVPIYGVLAARAPWDVQQFLVVPADCKPVKGRTDLFLEPPMAGIPGGGASSGPDSRAEAASPPLAWGLFLRGLLTVCRSLAECVRMPRVATIGSMALVETGHFVRWLPKCRGRQGAGGASGDIVDHVEALLEDLGLVGAQHPSVLQERLHRADGCLRGKWRRTGVIEATRNRPPHVHESKFDGGPRCASAMLVNGRTIDMFTDGESDRAALVAIDPFDDIRIVKSGCRNASLAGEGVWVFEHGECAMDEFAALDIETTDGAAIQLDGNVTDEP